MRPPRAHRQRQAEIGRKHGLQPAILAAARHYRTLRKNAKEAWRTIKERPYKANDTETVVVEVVKKNETMCVQLRRGKQKRKGIKFGQWRQRYWPAAAK